MCDDSVLPCNFTNTWRILTLCLSAFQYWNGKMRFTDAPTMNRKIIYDRRKRSQMMHSCRRSFRKSQKTFKEHVFENISARNAVLISANRSGFPAGARPLTASARVTISKRARWKSELLNPYPSLVPPDPHFRHTQFHPNYRTTAPRCQSLTSKGL